MLPFTQWVWDSILVPDFRENYFNYMLASNLVMFQVEVDSDRNDMLQSERCSFTFLYISLLYSIQRGGIRLYPRYY